MVPNTVRLVQLVEHQIVVLVVVGSSPTSHPCCNSRKFPGVALCLGAFDTRANFHIIDFRIFHQRDAAGGLSWCCPWSQTLELQRINKNNLHVFEGVIFAFSLIIKGLAPRHPISEPNTGSFNHSPNDKNQETMIILIVFDYSCRDARRRLIIIPTKVHLDLVIEL